MNRYFVLLSAKMVVDSECSLEEVANNIAARLEEIAQSNGHLKDYEITPYEINDLDDEPSH
jgi:hypothetical protein